MELLTSAIILVACISIGCCGIFITRNRTGINKHSRSYIKDMQQDLKYLAESKKQEALEYRKEILRLKSSVNRIKDGATVTDTDMQNSGLGEVIMQLIPNRYKSIAKPVVPMIEEAVKKDPTLLDKVYEKIKSANTSNQKAQPGSQTQTTNTL